MKNILKYLFHFFGSIHLALLLIAFAALIVIVGTLLESKTGSHLFAAQWTYESPLFLFLLCLFFINILFSALRRWPFQKKHIPFLITHFGLLMIISGVIVKNLFGLQGRLSVWEGSGNQQVLLPHTYALLIEKKGIEPNQKSLIPLESFEPKTYFSPQFLDLKFKIIAYTPHVKENLETWIKGTKGYISGLPPLPVYEWEPSQLIPKGIFYSLVTSKSEPKWNFLALRTSHLQEALQQAYVKGLILQLKAKNGVDAIEIPLQEALQKPFFFAQQKFSAVLHLSYFSLDKNVVPTLELHWQSQYGKSEKIASIPLKGQDSLFVKSDPSQWEEPFFHADLIRPQPDLYLIADHQGISHLFAFDSYGRLHGESFDPTRLQSLVSYDQGFFGYGIQATIPIPSFPTSRENKENALAYELTTRLQQMLSQPSTLNTPLRLLKGACEKAQLDFATTIVQLLVEWNKSPSLLFHPIHPLPDSLSSALNHLDWKEIESEEQQICLWTVHHFDLIEDALQKGDHPLKFLEQQRWPFLSELQQLMQHSRSTTPLNVFAQQIASLNAYLPSLSFPISPTLVDHARLLSAYFRLYEMDYRSLVPFQGNEEEEFDYLESYWKADKPQIESFRHNIVLETPLSHQIIPEGPPIKLEDRRPGIVLEVQQGLQTESIALAYDDSGTGLKWPVLEGKALVRFQPKLQELPHRIRLRQARQIFYPQSPQIYSYESDLLVSENGNPPVSKTLSMNHVYETWDGYRFYLAGVGNAPDSELKHIQLAVNHDPAKFFLTYPGIVLVFAGIILLFWIDPYRSRSRDP